MQHHQQVKVVNYSVKYVNIYHMTGTKFGTNIQGSHKMHLYNFGGHQGKSKYKGYNLNFNSSFG